MFCTFDTPSSVLATFPVEKRAEEACQAFSSQVDPLGDSENASKNRSTSSQACPLGDSENASN
jgi:hypothetical protein